MFTYLYISETKYKKVKLKYLNFRSKRCPDCRQACTPTVRLYLRSENSKSQNSEQELREQLAYKVEENYLYQKLVGSLQHKMKTQVEAKSDQLEEMTSLMHIQREMFKQVTCDSKAIINSLNDELENKNLELEEEVRISALKTHDIKIFQNLLKSNYIKCPSNQLKYQHQIDSIENENVETVNEEENYTKHSIRINGLTETKGTLKNIILILAEQMGIVCNKEDIDKVVKLPPMVVRNSKPSSSFIVNFKENDLKEQFVTNAKKLNKGPTNQYVKIVDYKPPTLHKKTSNNTLFG